MASTYLTRTPSSAGTQTKATISVWLKRANLTSNQCYFSTGNNNVVFKFVSNDKLTVYDYNGVSMDLELTTTQLFRDTSAWYHIVVSLDSTQATASDRAKLYVNGSLISNFDSTTYPTQNYNFKVNGTLEHFIGRLSGLSQYFDGSLAHFHNIDGTAYDASAFGETDATTGIWKPKTAPSVTYGTNGFFLKFENSGAFGTDSSGNGNNLTVNGTMTQTIDTPSNVFATGNPLYKWNYNLSSTNGNTSFSGSTTQWQGMSSTLGISKGKYYYEAKFTSATNITDWVIGFMGLEDYNLTNATRNLVGFYNFDGGEIWTADAVNNTATTNDYGTFSNGDIIGVALDYDNETISIYKNGSAMITNFNYGAVGTSTSLKGGKAITPVFVNYGSGGLSVNFGNGYFGTTAVASAQNPDDGIGIFEYSVPTGYKALCTKSINAQEYD